MPVSTQPVVSVAPEQPQPEQAQPQITQQDIQQLLTTISTSQQQPVPPQAQLMPTPQLPIVSVQQPVMAPVMNLMPSQQQMEDSKVRQRIFFFRGRFCIL